MTNAKENPTALTETEAAILLNPRPENAVGYEVTKGDAYARTDTLASDPASVANLRQLLAEKPDLAILRP